MSDNKLPEGIRYFEKHANAPDFVIDSLVITLPDFWDFVEQNPNLITEYQGKKQLKLQRLRSKQGKIYLSVDTFQPQAQQAPQHSGTPGEGETGDLPDFLK